jgi:hypothetical protein
VSTEEQLRVLAATATAMEAAADSLLSAVAVWLLVSGLQPTPHDSRDMALQMLDAVVGRTLREGAKPDD